MARIYLDRRTNWWCMDYRERNGHRRQVKAARTRSLAQEILSKKLDELTREKLSGRPAMANIKFREFAEEYIEKYAKVNKKSWGRDKYSIDHLNKVFGDKSLCEISSRDIEIYKGDRAAVVKKSTTNRELACMKCIFNVAIKWEYVNDNPVRRVSLFKENNQRVRYLEKNELVRLLAFSAPHLKPIIIMALNTGLRLSEVLSLTWADIDLQRRLIKVMVTKNNEPRYIPITNRLMDMLQVVPKRLDIPYLFVNEKGVPYKSVGTSFDNAVRRAGIKDFHFHDLRHTFASYLTMSGAGLRTVQELLGHKTITMTVRYSHLSPEHKQAAVDKMGEFMAWDHAANKAENKATYMQHEGDVKEAI
ncbi:MAG: site-specific integrase [Candidatus Brocadiia bacterium]